MFGAYVSNLSPYVAHVRTKRLCLSNEMLDSRLHFCDARFHGSRLAWLAEIFNPRPFGGGILLQASFFRA